MPGALLANYGIGRGRQGAVHKRTDAPGRLRDAAETGVNMRFINLFLIGYAVLALGAVIALWKLDILSRLGPVWIVVGVLAVIGVGIMVSVSSGKPAITQEVQR
jgi:hypothetical protein